MTTKRILRRLLSTAAINLTILCCLISHVQPAKALTEGVLYTNGTQEHTVTGLPPHTHLTISFSLQLHGSWDGGAAPPRGRDRWGLRVKNGVVLWDTTLSAPPPWRTRSFSFSHSGSSVTFEFVSATTDNNGEKWSVHNLQVTSRTATAAISFPPANARFKSGVPVIVKGSVAGFTGGTVRIFVDGNLTGQTSIQRNSTFKFVSWNTSGSTRGNHTIRAVPLVSDGG